MPEPVTPAPEQEGSALPEPPFHNSDDPGPSTNNNSNSQTQPSQTSNNNTGAKSSSGACVAVLCMEGA